MCDAIRTCLIVFLSMVLGWAVCARGQDTSWTAGTGDYFDANNWSNGLPADDAFINNGGTAQISTSGTGPVIQYVGNTPGSTGHLEMTSGDVTMYNLYLGGSGTATMNHTGGRLTLLAQCLLGISTGGVGTYELSGTAELYLTNYYSRQLDMGSHGTGIFRQSGGLVSITSSDVFIGCEEDDPEGRYELSGGRLVAQAINISYYGGPGVLQQSDGICEVTDTLLIRDRYEHEGGHLQAHALACTHRGVYRQTGGTASIAQLTAEGGDNASGEIIISGGELDVTGSLRVAPPYGYLGGTLRILGAGATVSAVEYAQASDGLLVSEIDAAGISCLDISGQASVDGQWEVVDAGAPLGRFTVLTSVGGISGNFASVVLPGADWSWGIDNGDTIWVEHVPEPATLSLLALGGLALLRRRRRCLGEC